MSIKKTIEIEAIAKDALEQIQALNAKVEGLEDALSKAGKATKGVEKGVKGIGNTLKAAGIGLAIAAFAKLVEVFNENQKVQDAFKTGFEALSLAFNDFFNFLDRNIGTVIGYFKGIFSDPQQAIVDFGNSIKANLVERFNSFLDTLGFLASAVKKVFSGDFAGALSDVKEAGKESLDVLTGVNDSFDKSVEAVTNVTASIVEYTKSTVAAARETVNLQKKAEVGIAQNRIILEQKDREAEKLRQIRDDETKTIAQRIAANNKLAEVLNEQERLMLANADAVIAAAQAQFDKNGNDENQIALLDARAEREGILAQIEGFRSEQLINRISLERERVDLLDEEAEKQKENAEEAIRLSEAVKEAKLNDATNTLSQVAQLAGEGSAIGKAAAVSSATISGIEGVQNAYTTAQKSPITALFPAYPIVQAGLAAAFSAMQIKSILSTPKPSAGGGGGGGSQPSVPAPPSFNVVGASETSQLSQTIGEKEDKPVKAFVVSNDVTTAQSLDRNIVEGASLG